MLLGDLESFEDIDYVVVTFPFNSTFCLLLDLALKKEKKVEVTLNYLQFHPTVF